MLLFQKAVKFARFFKPLKLVFQVHCLHILALGIDGLFASSNSFFIRPFQCVFLYLCLPVILLSSRELFLFIEHLFELVDLIQIAPLVSLGERGLQMSKSFILVVFDEAVRFGEETLVELSARAIETRITSEVFVSCPVSTHVAAETFVAVLLVLDNAYGKFRVALTWCLLVLDLAFGLFVGFLSVTPLL